MALAIDDLNPDPRNARAHDERNIKAVMDSYAKHGQRKPIVVQAVADNGTRMVIRAGNGQATAAKRLGWTHIACIVIDENDADAVAFALRDNRTAELAEWDLQALSDNMRYLKAHDVDVASVGWEPYEAEPLLAADWVPPPKEPGDFDVPEKHESVKFTAEQWSEMKLLVGAKPTAADIIRLIKAGRVSEQEDVS